MPFDPDKIIAVATDLKLAKQKVTKLEDELRRIVAQQGEQVKGDVIDDAFASQSVPDRVLTLFTNNPDKEFSFQDTLKVVGGNELYLRSLLSRMVKDKRIESRGWGKYGAKGENKERLKAV